MQTIDNLLVRMKQLAEQASTGTYSDDQRDIMNSEFQESAAEIERISGSAKFNDITLLNATTGVSIVFGESTDTITVYKADMTTGGLSIGSLNIDSATGAAAALTAMDTAITDANTARAAFGYKMSRLESIVEVLNIQAENLQSAESRISDVDVATEITDMTRTQVLAQAGVAMLAQANAIPQMALTLLR
jgi:flagellin